MNLKRFINGWQVVKKQSGAGVSSVDFDSFLTDQYTLYKLYVTNFTVSDADCYACMRFGEGSIYSDAGGYSFDTDYYSPASGDRYTDYSAGQTALRLSGTTLMNPSAFSNYTVVRLVRNPDGFISADWCGIFETGESNMDRTIGGGSCEINDLTSLQIFGMSLSGDSADVTINGDFVLMGLNTAGII